MSLHFFIIMSYERRKQQLFVTLDEGLIITKNDGAFSCPVCGKTFVKPQTIQIHYRKCQKENHNLSEISSAASSAEALTRISSELSSAASSAEELSGEIPNQMDGFQALNIRVNRPAGTIICQSCPSLLTRSNLYYHLSKIHAIPNWKTKLQSISDKIPYDLDEMYLKPGSNPVPAIQGNY